METPKHMACMVGFPHAHATTTATTETQTQISETNAHNCVCVCVFGSLKINQKRRRALLLSTVGLLSFAMERLIPKNLVRLE